MKNEEFLNIRYSIKSNLNINDFTITTITPKIIGQEMKDNIEYFRINITDNYHKKAWFIEKDSSDFSILYNQLSISFYNIPQLPPKNLLTLFDAESIKTKKEMYQNFLSSCINRKDIYSSIEFKNFIELKKNSPELFGNKPILSGKIEFLPKSITDILYIEFELENINILILSSTEMGIHDIKTNEEFLNFQNSSNEEYINNNNILGMTIIFQVIHNNEKYYEFNQIWQRKFKTPNTCLYFDKATKLFFIGREDGFVSVYKILLKKNSIELLLNIELKNHFSRIVDIWYDPNRGKMYTISTDRRFVSCDVNINSKMVEINRNVHNYTKLYPDLEKNRIFTGTEGGIIEIFSTRQYPILKVGKLQVSGLGNISDLFYEKNNSRLFACDKKGKISIFEIGDVGKEKISLEISQFGFKNPFNSFKYNNTKKEIITGDNLGKITIWNIKTGEPIFSWVAHEKMPINCLFYLEDKRLLITGGRDKSVKFWKIPEFWFDEKLEKYEKEDLVKINNELRRKRLQMEKIIEGNNEVNYESDISENEEELNGWNYDSDEIMEYESVNVPK